MSPLSPKPALSHVGGPALKCLEGHVLAAVLGSLAVAATLLVAAPAHAQRFAHPAPGVVVTVEPFYEALAPYGEWRVVDPYGWVWSPAGVAVDWRPYSTGHWVPTDQGWLWEDEAEWGWAPFHYGRWAYETAVGWIWIPGAEWAPAWVTWRYGEGWVGWAPLSPQVAFSVEVAPGAWEVGISSAAWCFVAAPQFLHPHLHTIIVAPRDNVVVVNRTRNITRYRRGPRGVTNEGLSFHEAERLVGRRFSRRSIVEAELRPGPSLPADARHGYEREAPGVVEVYRPVVVREGRAEHEERADPRRVGRERPQPAEQLERGDGNDHGSRDDRARAPVVRQGGDERADRPARRGGEGGARPSRGRRR